MSFPPTRLSVVARTRSERRRDAAAGVCDADRGVLEAGLQVPAAKWHLDPDAGRRSDAGVLHRHAREGRARPLRRGARALSHLPAAVPRRLRVERAKSRRPSQARRRRDDRAARFRVRRRRAAAARAVRRRRMSTSCSIRSGCARCFSAPSPISAPAAHASGRDAMFAVFERYDLVEPTDERPTYAAIARDLGLDAATRHQSPGRDAPAVPPARARSAARSHDDRRGVRGRGEAAARWRVMSAWLGDAHAGPPARRRGVARPRRALRGHRAARPRRHGCGLRRAAIARSIATWRSRCSIRVAHDAAADRLRAEAQILGRLEHPGHRAGPRRRARLPTAACSM